MSETENINLAMMPGLIRVWQDMSALPPDARDLTVAIGNFDGVHLGHQAVITAAQRQARELGTQLGVLTFNPNPRRFFTPAAPPSELTPLHVRARYMVQLGVQHLYVQKFDKTFSQIEDAVFISDILNRQLSVRHVVVGENFQFGHRRSGDVDFLIDQAPKYGFGVTRVPPARVPGGQAYSSSRIRQFLQVGDPVGARQLLGRPFELEGVVEHGAREGHELGFPTANIALGNYLRPHYGVYAVKAAVVGHGGVPEWYSGVANLGVRPTFRGGKELLEVHLFDFDGDLYDQRLRIQLWYYLRPEEKFGKMEALRRQIALDVKQARQKLEA